ncbi:MAG: hypothetical protein GC152_05620 [Alphaproteobacteria bacterium]|nr:hypothetical protein [Alphaproteobacteria bacterium]
MTGILWRSAGPALVTLLMAVVCVLAMSRGAAAQSVSCASISGLRGMPPAFAGCRVWTGSPEGLTIAYRGAWGPDAPNARAGEFNAVKEAGQKSLDFFRRFYRPPSPTLIYITDEAGPRAGLLAYNNRTQAELRGPCWIATTGEGISESLEALKQTIAHEIGHCLIDDYAGVVATASSMGSVTFGDEPPGGAAGEAADAVWFEGIAEYIGNQVYVDIDAEHSSSRAYDNTWDVFVSSYANVVFFQHYGNERGGPRAVLDLGAALARHEDKSLFFPVLMDIPRIEEFWLDFAMSYVDGDIRDIGIDGADGALEIGETIPFAEPAALERGGGAGTISSDFAAFSFKPQTFTLAGGGKYTIEMPSATAGTMLAAIKREGRWERMSGPVDISVDCESEETVTVLAALISGDNDLPTATIADEAGDNEACPQPCDCPPRIADSCPTGTWAMGEGGRDGYIFGSGTALSVEQLLTGFGASPAGGGTFEWTTRYREVDGHLVIRSASTFEGPYAESGSTDFVYREGSSTMSGNFTMRQRLTSAGRMCFRPETGDACVADVTREYQEYDGLLTVNVPGAGAFSHRMSDPVGGWSQEDPAPVWFEYSCAGDALVMTLDYRDERGAARLNWRFRRIADR